MLSAQGIDVCDKGNKPDELLPQLFQAIEYKPRQRPTDFLNWDTVRMQWGIDMLDKEFVE